MKPEDKAAITAGGATALVAGTIAACLTTPVAWAAVLYGTYRMSKAARAMARERSKQGSVPTDHDLYI